MKRMIAILLAVLTTAVLLTGCGGRDNTNVSTTPNGTVNGTNPSAGNEAPMPQNPGREPMDPTTENADRQENNRQESGASQSGPMEDFGNDMEDAAQDIIDGAEKAVDDAVGGRSRSRSSGTGMTGGR